VLIDDAAAQHVQQPRVVEVVDGPGAPQSCCAPAGTCETGVCPPPR
jgi:hypothetical protein